MKEELRKSTDKHINRMRRASERTSADRKSTRSSKENVMTKSLEDNLDGEDKSPIRTRRDGGGICSTLCWGYGRPESMDRLDTRGKSPSPTKSLARTKSPTKTKSPSPGYKSQNSTPATKKSTNDSEKENIRKKDTLKGSMKSSIEFLDVYQSQIWSEVDEKSAKKGTANYKHVVKETKI